MIKEYTYGIDEIICDYCNTTLAQLEHLRYYISHEDWKEVSIDVKCKKCKENLK